MVWLLLRACTQSHPLRLSHRKRFFWAKRPPRAVLVPAPVALPAVCSHRYRQTLPRPSHRICSFSAIFWQQPEALAFAGT